MDERKESRLERARRETAAHIGAADLSIAQSDDTIRQSKGVIRRSLRLLNWAGRLPGHRTVPGTQ